MKIGSQRAPGQAGGGQKRPPRIRNAAQQSFQAPRRRWRCLIVGPRSGDELEAEIAAALEGTSLIEMVDPAGRSTKALDLQPDTRMQATVLKIYQGDVFGDLGSFQQGTLPVLQFNEPPVAAKRWK